MSNQPVIDDLKQRLEAVEDAKRSAFSDLEAERRDQKRSLSDVTSQHATMTKEKADLVKRKTELETDNVTFRKRVTDLQSKLTGMETKMSAQVATLEKTGSAIEKEKVALELKIKLNEAKIREIEQMKADTADALRMTAEESHHFKAQGEMETKKNVAAEASITAVTARVAELKTKLEEEKAARLKTVTEGATATKTLNEEIVQLKASLGEAQHKCDAAIQKSKVLTASNSQLKAQKGELQTTTASLRNKTSHLDKEVRDLTRFNQRQAARSPAPGRSPMTRSPAPMRKTPRTPSAK